MREPLTDEEREMLEQQLYELKLEHRDLDDVITRLTNASDVEELQLKRFKKRKLRLKENIAKIADRLIPDIEA